MDTYIVYVTAKDSEEACEIAKAAVSEKLAACANIIGNIKSIYEWQGKICEENEVSLILKTKKSLVDELTNKICAIHSYECPCVIATPIEKGNKDFINWINEVTK